MRNKSDSSKIENYPLPLLDKSAIDTLHIKFN